MAGVPGEARAGLEAAPPLDSYATVVHDLKTPIAVAIALCASAAATDDVDQLHDDVAQVAARLRAVGRQLDLLLERERVRALPEAREEIDLVGLVRECVATLRPLAAARGVTLTIDTPTTLRAHLQGERCSAAVANLLANALRHARDDGVVRLRLALRAGWARLEVADDGPGVPERDRAGLFEPFRMLERDVAMTGRSGLGLAIVRDVALAQGGTVDARSAPEGGALFVVRLPLDARARQPPEA